jgi:hypothetical protein
MIIYRKLNLRDWGATVVYIAPFLDQIETVALRANMISSGSVHDLVSDFVRPTMTPCCELFAYGVEVVAFCI